jgi:hypothetical protein
MNRTWMLLLAAGGAALIFAADQPKKEPSEFEKLKAKVTLLEGRINQLEARLVALSQTPRTAFETPLILPNADGTVPPNVGEFEVNGLKVYKVPLSSVAK